MREGVVGSEGFGSRQRCSGSSSFSSFSVFLFWEVLLLDVSKEEGKSGGGRGKGRLETGEMVVAVSNDNNNDDDDFGGVREGEGAPPLRGTLLNWPKGEDGEEEAVVVVVTVELFVVSLLFLLLVTITAASASASSPSRRVGGSADVCSTSLLRSSSTQRFSFLLLISLVVLVNPLPPSVLCIVCFVLFFCSLVLVVQVVGVEIE